MTRSRGVKAPPYSLREDRIILAMPQITTTERERLLPGRSPASIRQRRSRLREHGVTLETVSAYHFREPDPEREPVTLSTGRVPDRVIWAIVQELHKPDRRTWSQVARDLRIPRAVVVNQVNRLRARGGWMCPLTHTPCRVCGEPVIARAWGATGQHPPAVHAPAQG